MRCSALLISVLLNKKQNYPDIKHYVFGLCRQVYWESDEQEGSKALHTTFVVLHKEMYEV